jgi:hypothetical protein
VAEGDHPRALVMGVTEILERARQCFDMAERMTGEERTKLLEIADAWLKLADETSKAEAQRSNDQLRGSSA